VRSLAAASLLAVLATLALAVAGAPRAGAETLPEGFRDEVVFEKLNQPTSFKFAPDGRTFVALKGGKIVVYPSGSTPTAKPTEFANLAKQVYDNTDHGLLGLALDPKFDQGRPYVYALFSYDHELGSGAPAPKYGTGPGYEGDPCPTPASGCQVSGRLVRLTAEGNHAKPSAAAPEVSVLLEDWCQQFSSHSIGDLGFGPEGALFVSGGEGASFENPDWGQFGNPCGDPPGPAGSNLAPPAAEGGSLRSQSALRPGGAVGLDGALLRIDPDTGAGWPGNPYILSPDANKRRIVAFGFRNPFRFAIAPETNSVYVNNVGNGEDEEIDRVPIGSSQAYNSGWPCYEGTATNYQFAVAGLEACQRLYDLPGSVSPPFFSYKHKDPVAPGDSCPSYNGSAISGSAFYEGSTYPGGYDRALFFADSVRGCIYAMLADPGGAPDPARVVPFLGDASSYPGTDVEQGPDGEIYYGSVYGETINRIDYGPGVPTAVLGADREWGTAPLTVEFDAGKSSGEPGSPLGYEWDLDGDGSFDDGGGATRTETYAAAVNVEVGVRVRDEVTTKSAVAHLTIYPGDEPPQIAIVEPSPSLTWGVGQNLHFSGTAKEFDGDPITGSRLQWDARVLHCPVAAQKCHEHPLQTFSGVLSGNVAAPNHDYPSYVNFIFTATDERGLRGRQAVEVAARPVTLALRSSPPGVLIAVGNEEKGKATPFERQVIENSPTTVSAPAAAQIGGVTYSFRGWSDGGARTHTLPASSSGTFTALYAAPIGPPPPPVFHRPAKIKQRPAKTTTSTTAKFVFGGESGLRFRCRIDAKKFAACSSPRTYRQLKRGRHSFRVYPVDASEAQVAKATVFSWKIVPKR
jgi:glucose/arabinose dehydrogenase